MHAPGSRRPAGPGVLQQHLDDPRGGEVLGQEADSPTRPRRSISANSTRAKRCATPFRRSPFPGEQNQLQYTRLGAVVPPWNLPCAIMTGMTTAALVTGNTVVLKPSSDAPAIAAFFTEIRRRPLPAGVVNYVSGGGGTVGNTIVERPLTRFVAFTGSKEVGLAASTRRQPTASGPDLDQAGDRRDGGQGLRRRRGRRWTRR